MCFGWMRENSYSLGALSAPTACIRPPLDQNCIAPSFETAPSTSTSFSFAWAKLCMMVCLTSSAVSAVAAPAVSTSTAVKIRQVPLFMTLSLLLL